MRSAKRPMRRNLLDGNIDAKHPSTKARQMTIEIQSQIAVTCMG